MKEIMTKDGTVTYHNEKVDETYHSISGALEEAQKKFVEPCKIKAGDKVLDICFGLGYNAAAALEKGAIITALEIDGNLKDIIKNTSFPLKSYDIVKKVVAGNPDERLTIIWGDARETIKTLKTIKKSNQYFDAVFLDPFSPKKAPELWTKEFFREIKQVLKLGAVLTTYSCARIVRDNLKETGFQVKDGPCVGRKSPSTVAINL